MWKQNIARLFALSLFPFITACPPEAIESCGDGIIQDNLSEQCEGSNLGPNSCETLGFTGGVLLCDNQCQLITQGCFNGPACGNGTQEGNEECDDGNTTGGDGCNGICVGEFCGDGLDNNGNQETCDDGNNLNTDACTNNCQAASCGDGFIQSGVETCDDGNNLNTDACANCQLASCGDGFIQTGVETCDDENTTNGDGCSANCQIEIPVGCGDGVVQGNLGEQCEDGNTVNNDGCSANCKIENCGDNIVQGPLGEQCDDGNIIAGDGCNAACRTEVCGDGVDNNGALEQCDDGCGGNGCTAADNGDGCTSTCVLERCGDGVDNNGATEACDDGNQSNTDACTNACQLPRCGDTFTQSGEQCDDGNQSNTDTCRNTCQSAICGDTFVRAGVEQCDDGNTTNGDGCSSTCTTEGAVCGNGQVQAGEQCDDGNQINTDACLATCQNASCGDGFVRAGAGAEQCDDGNTTNGDGCSSTCTTEAVGCTATTAASNGVNNGTTDGNQDLFDVDGCFGSNGPEDIFSFTPNTTGTLTLSLADNDPGSVNDLVLYVRAACEDALSEIGCADDEVGNPEVLSLSVTAGIPLFIFADGFDPNDAGPYTLTLSIAGGAACGNGVVEGAEQCDDNNTTANDGCEADCSLICGGNSGAVRATLDTANGHCYLGFSENLDWIDAEVACESFNGGTLAVITSAAENTLARKASLSTDTAWIGAEDTSVEGAFEWINGEAFGFTSFEPGQPDNDASTGANGDCLHFHDAATSPTGATNTWNDTNCDFVGFVTGYICEIAPAGGVGKLVINEVDYDQVGTDGASFIEIKNVGTAAATLNDFAVVLINGSNSSQYARFDLATAGTSLAPGQFLVVANTAVTVAGGAIKFVPAGVANTDFIQNGPPDGVALLQISTSQVVDALSYEGPITAATITGITGTFNLVEGTAFTGADTNDNLNSLSRSPDGTDTNNAATDWALKTPTPGAANQ